MMGARRQKVFGPGHAVPLDRNAKVRIAAYARAWSARHRQPRQHHGPITMAFERVLMALLWSFHNSRDGRCFPGYERIAEQARCARSTVAEVLKALEWAGVLSWQHRIASAGNRPSSQRQRETFDLYDVCLRAGVADRDHGATPPNPTAATIQRTDRRSRQSTDANHAVPGR